MLIYNICVNIWRMCACTYMWRAFVTSYSGHSRSVVKKEKKRKKRSAYTYRAPLAGQYETL